MVTYLVFVITSVLVACVAALIAHRANKNVLNWFVAGLVLNVVTFVALWYWGERRERGGLS